MSEQTIDIATAPRDRKEDLYTARPWQLIWRRFSRHALAVASLWFLAILALCAVFAEQVAPYDPFKVQRLRTLAGRRLTDDDVIVITAQRFRTQEHNKRDALERLGEMVAQARIEPRVRKATKPTRASKERRLEGKQKRSQVKKGRKVTHDW
mgnify:CR=1 FL=1